MAVFRYGRPITVGTQGVLSSDTPLTVGVQGILEPVQVGVVSDITLGGEAGVTVSIGYEPTGIIIIGGDVPIIVTTDGQLVFDYKPSSVNTINVSGDALLVATIDGILDVSYVPSSPIPITTGGTAAVVFEDFDRRHIATGGIIIGGEVPIITTIGGETTYQYPPLVGIDLTISGASPIVVLENGLLKVTYPVSPAAFAGLGGEANIGTTIGGINEEEYYAFGGLISGGTALVEFAPSEEQRGGKGTPVHRRKKVVQPHHYYYKAEAFFEQTLQIGGQADTLFIPARYQFIKTLPVLPKPELIPDSEFKKLYKELQKRKPTKVYSYVPTGSVRISGRCEEDYFDFQNFIVSYDDDLIIADIMGTEENPFVVTKFDHSFESHRKEENELIELGLL